MTPASIAHLKRLTVLLALATATARPVVAQSDPATDAALHVGVRVERNYATQPGLEVAYQRTSFAGGHPRASLAWSTTRLATALGRNELAADRLLLGAAWHVRPHRLTDPFVGIELGVARFGREDADLFRLLDNDAPVLNVLVGLERRMRDRRVALRASIGYSALSSSTVYPVVLRAGIGFRVPGGGH